MGSSSSIFQKFGGLSPQRKLVDAKTVNLDSDTDDCIVTTAALNKLGNAIQRFEKGIKDIDASTMPFAADTIRRMKHQCVLVLFEAIRTFHGLTYQPPIDPLTYTQPEPIKDELFIQAYLHVMKARRALTHESLPDLDRAYQMLEKALLFTRSKIDNERLAIVAAVMQLGAPIVEDKPVNIEEVIETHIASMPKLFAELYHQMDALIVTEAQEHFAADFNLKTLAFRDAVMHMNSVTPKDHEQIVALRRAIAAKSVVLEALSSSVAEKVKPYFNTIQDYFSQAINQLMRTKAIAEIDLTHLDAEMKAFHEKHIAVSAMGKVGNYISKFKK